MSWPILKNILDVSIEDLSGQIAYRIAMRISPSIAGDLVVNRVTKETRIPLVFLSFRSLMTMKVALDDFSFSTGIALDDVSQQLDPYTSNFNYFIRVARAAARCVPPGRRYEKIENIRKAIQAASDSIENLYRYELTYPQSETRSYLPITSLAEEDASNLIKGVRLDAPLPISYFDSAAWKNFEKQLLALDESWRIWILWLRYRALDLSSDEIPPQVWPKIERTLVLKPNEFWAQSELSINAYVSQLVVDEVDVILQEEAEREQSRLGRRFIVKSDGKIDLDENIFAEKDKIISSVAREVFQNAQALLELCQSNSAADLKKRVKQYIDIMPDSVWDDDMILVMRGDVLRKELAFQENRDEDSDLPEIGQSTLLALEQTVRMHNMLVNSHDNLAKIDKMLLGPQSQDGDLSNPELRQIIYNAETREALSVRAQQALEEIAPENLADSKIVEERFLYIRLSIGNLFRTSIRALWSHRKKALATGGSLGAFYTIGHWMIVNEQIITGYFVNNAAMKALLIQLFAWLKTLPLL